MASRTPPCRCLTPGSWWTDSWAEATPCQLRFHSGIHEAPRRHGTQTATRAGRDVVAWPLAHRDVYMYTHCACATCTAVVSLSAQGAPGVSACKLMAARGGSVPGPWGPTNLRLNFQQSTMTTTSSTENTSLGSKPTLNVIADSPSLQPPAYHARQLLDMAPHTAALSRPQATCTSIAAPSQDTPYPCRPLLLGLWVAAAALTSPARVSAHASSRQVCCACR